MVDRRLIAIRWISGFVLVAMALTIAYGFVAGEFGEEGSAILDLAWGRVTLIDLYLGFALFGAWIVLRERSPKRAVPWLVALAVLGNLAAAAYAFLAARESDSLEMFFLGAGRR